MFDVVDLPLCWPVEVNYHEAKAYCCWTGPDFRLLAEAEYHALRTPRVIQRRRTIPYDTFNIGLRSKTGK